MNIRTHVKIMQIHPRSRAFSIVDTRSPFRVLVIMSADGVLKSEVDYAMTMWGAKLKARRMAKKLKRSTFEQREVASYDLE